MKTQLFVSTLAIVASSTAFAQGFSDPQQPAGFQGPNHGISTVQQVLDAGTFSDDTPVTLTGHIKASLGGEMYLFTDTTGEIQVEIDHDKWRNQSATPETKVQLIGEIDKELSETKVDVDVIKVF